MENYSHASDARVKECIDGFENGTVRFIVES
jgi:hypothetical protein